MSFLVQNEVPECVTALRQHLKAVLGAGYLGVEQARQCWHSHIRNERSIKRWKVITISQENPTTRSGWSGTQARVKRSRLLVAGRQERTFGVAAYIKESQTWSLREDVFQAEAASSVMPRGSSNAWMQTRKSVEQAVWGSVARWRMRELGGYSDWLGMCSDEVISPEGTNSWLQLHFKKKEFVVCTHNRPKERKE